MEDGEDAAVCVCALGIPPCPDNCLTLRRQRKRRREGDVLGIMGQQGSGRTRLEMVMIKHIVFMYEII